MRINVFHSAQMVTESQMRSCTVIVVDVLRSTTSIVCALKNGASQIIPAHDAGEAALLQSQLGRKESLLAGESDGLKLPGFDFGNSPLEFTTEKINGKAIVMSTSNGTNAIHHARVAAVTLIGALINRTAAAQKAVDTGNDIIVLCAGTNGQFSADDIICAGGIVSAINALLETSAPMNDLAYMATELYSSWNDKRFSLEKTSHYAHLKQLGFTEDLKFCFTEDITNVVPVYSDGVIQ